MSVLLVLIKPFAQEILSRQAQKVEQQQKAEEKA
jgi:hypothetical protein